MKIVDAEWAPKVNLLHILCDKCQKIFKHRCDRWTVYCTHCGASGCMQKMRDEFGGFSRESDLQILQP